MIKCSSICKSYNNNIVLNDFTYEFLSGSTYLCGKNGSGKSTLLKIIAGVETLDSGIISFSKENSRSLANVSIATDSIHMPNIFTPYELQKLIARYQSINQYLFKKLVTEMELESVLHTSLSKLSTGMKKKVFNILALTKNSRILILDEPFNALDSSSIDQLANFIAQDKRDKIITDHHRILPYDHSLCL